MEERTRLAALGRVRHAVLWHSMQGFDYIAKFLEQMLGAAVATNFGM